MLGPVVSKKKSKSPDLYFGAITRTSMLVPSEQQRAETRRRRGYCSGLGKEALSGTEKLVGNGPKVYP